VAVELCVLSLVDDTHAAAPELFQNAIVGNSLTDHGETASEYLESELEYRHHRPCPQASQRSGRKVSGRKDWLTLLMNH
jgi:hypothetical protein